MKRFSLIYKIDENSEFIKIFDSLYIKNNKRKCRIIYKNKILSLTDKFQNFDKKKKILKIELLILDSNILNLKRMFSGCISLLKFLDLPLEGKEIIDNNLLYEDSIKINKSNFLNDYSIKPNYIQITDLSFIFSGCTSLISLPDLSLWDTCKITDFSNMFKDCSSLKSLPDISNWNTYKVNNMKNMFYGCSSLISLPEISKWNIGNVTDLSGMFYKCSSLKMFPHLSLWNTINVKDISRIFGYCTSICFMPNLLACNFENLEEAEDIFKGLKMLDSNAGYSILEGKKRPELKEYYNKIFNIIANRYPNSNWYFVEPQNSYILQTNNSNQNNNDIYENNDIIKILDKDFIRKYKIKCKIIYRNKIYNLNNELSILGKNNIRTKKKINYI